MTTLTMWQTVLQSQALHPGWTAEEHLAYLRLDDLEHDPGTLTGGTPEEVIGRWLAENITSGRLEIVWRNAGMPARPCGGHHPDGAACSGCAVIGQGAGAP
jgi:hypothetical protein